MKKTVLITGIPRSGTSLLIKLLSEQHNTVCFSEPKWLKEIRHDKQSCEEFSKKLEEKIFNIRNEIKRGNPIELTTKKGSNKLPDNYYIKGANKIVNVKETRLVHVEHSKDLIVCVKSNTLFTVCLQQLIDKRPWKIISVVRNPLYVLLSWRSLDIPISKGLIKIGEIYSREIREIVKEKNLLIRQVKILDWFYKTYFLYNKNTLKYEELVNDPQDIVNEILNSINCRAINLKTKNHEMNYSCKEKSEILRVLDAHAKHAKMFYSN